MITNPGFHNKTFIISLVSATGLLITALALGVSDNPPGAILMFAAMFALMLALVHHWRGPRRFRRMMFFSLAGFPVMVILHNALHVLVDASPGWLQPVVSALSVTSFFVALFVLPVTFFAGVIGLGLTTFFKRKE